MKNKNNKGIVIQVNPGKKQITILTPDGTFKKIPLKGEKPQVGEEIEFFELVMNKIRWRNAAVVAASCILVIVSWYFFNLFHQGATRVALDINPSLEIELNRYDRITEIETFNEEGEILLEKAGTPRYSSAEEGIDRLLRQAEKMDFLGKDNNLIMLSLVYCNSRDQQDQLLNKIEASLSQSLTDKSLGYELVINQVNEKEIDPQVKKEANKANLNSNEMLLMNASRKTEEPVSPDEIKEKRPAQMFKEIKEKLEEVPAFQDGKELPPPFREEPGHPPGETGPVNGGGPPGKPPGQDDHPGKSPEIPPGQDSDRSGPPGEIPGKGPEGTGPPGRN